MDNRTHEPTAGAPALSPHSVPVDCLNASPLVGEVGGGPAASAAERNLQLAPLAVAADAPPPNPPHKGEGSGPAISSYATRHDGWTGEKMAIFCEALAETAVVAEACEVARMGISGAYAQRRRNPVFAAAWDAALTIARERLADTLLARSMEGNIEQIYKDGELVGERHVLDNRLGLQILRRLDRLADAPKRGKTCSCEGRSPVQHQNSLGPCFRRGTGNFDWARAVDALRCGDDTGVAMALALVEGDEVEEVEGAPNRPLCGQDDEDLDLSDRCWWDEDSDCWLTDFPPPAGFAGYENRPYDESQDEQVYVRACTEEEAAILEADQARARTIERWDQEDLRDRWFALLKRDVEELQNGE